MPNSISTASSTSGPSSSLPVAATAASPVAPSALNIPAIITQQQKPLYNNTSSSNLPSGQASAYPSTSAFVTTTTATIEYPPLYISRPPVPTQLDSNLYPLANTPTPPTLKRFCFDLNGVPTNFREIELDQKVSHKRLL